MPRLERLIADCMDWQEKIADLDYRASQTLDSSCPDLGYDPGDLSSGCQGGFGLQRLFTSAIAASVLQSCLQVSYVNPCIMVLADAVAVTQTTATPW